MATIGVTPMLLALVALDLLDGSASRYMDRHSLTVDALVSMLVLLITVLNVDQIARRRQLREREQVTAAQAAILGRQGMRAADQVIAALSADARAGADREPASDEVGTYMSMLLVAAPLLIDAAPARSFLEQAQRLGGLLAFAIGHAGDADAPDQRPRVKTAAQAMSDAAQPLLSILDLAQLRAVDGGDDDDDAAELGPSGA